jgi:hypothetical protein
VKKTALIVVILAAIFLWHVYVCLSMENESYNVSPVTDVVTLKLPGAASYGITDPQEAAGFNGGRDLVGVPNAEHKLNLYARQYLDVYAMIVPYRVSIIDK